MRYIVLLLFSTVIFAETDYSKLPRIKKEVFYFDVMGAQIRKGRLNCNQQSFKRKGNSLEGTWVNKQATLVTQCNLDLLLNIKGCEEKINSTFSILEKMTLNYKGKCKKQIDLTCLRGLNMNKGHVETECSLYVK